MSEEMHFHFPSYVGDRRAIIDAVRSELRAHAARQRPPKRLTLRQRMALIRRAFSW